MQEKRSLKRSLGLWLLIFYGLGNILGAGIYVLVGKVAGEAGYYAPLSFLIAATVAAFTVLTYAELSARFPVSAGEAVYLQKGFGQVWLSVLGGLFVASSGMLSCATMVRGFSGYMQVFFKLPDWFLIISVLFVLGLVAIWGISESVKIAAALTLIEIAGLLLIIATGIPKFDQLPELHTNLPSLGNFPIWSSILAGSFLAFYAFTGFEDMVNVAEEVEEPEKNMPRAIILSLIISTFLYMLVSLVAVVNLSPEELSSSNAPLADIYTSATGKKPVVITLIGLFAVINGALIQIIMAARVFYGMSKQGWIPEFFAQISERTQTPVTATIIVVSVITLLAICFPLQQLAEFTSFLILTMFTLVNFALLRIRKRYDLPKNVRGFPAWIPVTGAIGSLSLLLAQIISMV
jgi:basic amino acid/polyamine antiporter, APA family